MVRPTFEGLREAATPYDYDERYGQRWPSDMLQQLGLDALGASYEACARKLAHHEGRLVLTKGELTGPLAPLAAASAPWASHALYGVLVLLWGYASQGYGEFRVRRILEANGVQRIGEVVKEAALALERGDLGAAYDAFYVRRSTLKWVGESFFTKLLFFLARAQPSSVPAYIKDVHTTRGAVALGGGEELKRVGRSGYLRFVAFLQALAVEHGLSGEGVEEVLFQSSRDALVSRE